MKIKVLEFDKREIDINEIRENVKFYVDKCNYGFQLISHGDNKGAMEILREIRNLMKFEENYYNKYMVQEVILNNRDYNNYCSAINDIMAHQTQTTSYKMLSSNLYDIEDYMRYHCSDMLK